MNIPKIETLDGGMKPITDFPDDMLVEAYLTAIANMEESELSENEREEAELVRFLSLSNLNAKEAGSILRQCFTGNHKLMVVNYGLDFDETLPPNATHIECYALLESSLYFV